jgi:hypothetical protein
MYKLASANQIAQPIFALDSIFAKTESKKPFEFAILVSQLPQNVVNGISFV